MKIIFALLFFWGVTAAAASQSVQFYSVDTNQMTSEYDLATECSSDADAAAKKLLEISTRLTGKADALTVSGGYGWTPNTPFFPTQLDGNEEFYCILEFSSADPAVQFNAYSPARKLHLSGSEWDTACDPAYQAAVANPNSPVTIYSESWTLIQGRICEVDTVEAIKKTP